jgi:DNA (cytosine-5)-methyltransferase 1
MGIFCGGGNLDPGVAEGGVVDVEYAVDYAEKAIHTYRVNASEDDVKFFFGSVDDYLAQAMQGTRKQAIAKPGDVDLLAGGSPCPGFSDLQQDKTSFQSLRNASKVASFVSFVYFYTPSYCMLENVVSMSKGTGLDKSENVFTHILAALVGLGYQVQQFLMDTV